MQMLNLFWNPVKWEINESFYRGAILQAAYLNLNAEAEIETNS